MTKSIIKWSIIWYSICFMISCLLGFVVVPLVFWIAGEQLAPFMHTLKVALLMPIPMVLIAGPLSGADEHANRST